MPNFHDGYYVYDENARVRMVEDLYDGLPPGDGTHSYTIRAASHAPQQVIDILEHHLPIWLDLFQRKSRDYGDAAFELGERAQFVDMNRKFRKLKAAMWDGEELSAEGVDEILLDLIGHCFLTLEMRRRDSIN